METIEFKATNYPSDLSDAQWEQIAEYFPQGPNSDHHKRSLIKVASGVHCHMIFHRILQCILSTAAQG